MFKEASSYSKQETCEVSHAAERLEALYPKPDLSKSLKEHKKYPYLFCDVEITMPDEGDPAVID